MSIADDRRRAVPEIGVRLGQVYRNGRDQLGEAVAFSTKGKMALKYIEKEKDDLLETMMKNLSRNEKVELLGNVKLIITSTGRATT